MNLAGIPPFSGFIGKLGLLEAGVADGSRWRSTLVAGGVVTSLLTLLAIARVWTRAFWRPAGQEPLADTAAAAASDAGAEVREPVPVGAGGAEDPRRATAQPTVRQAAWSAAWRRHEDVATAGTSRPADARGVGAGAAPAARA